MLDKRNDILELNSEDFENPQIKNTFIQSTNAEWIVFLDASVTDKGEIEHIIRENPFLLEYDAFLFGAEVPEEEISLQDMLECPQSVVFAFCFRRDLLIKTGSFNLFLTRGGNYEFLLRLTENGRVYSVPCNAEKELKLDPVAMAYIVRRYMSFLKETGRLDEIFIRVVQLTECLGMAEEFNQTMNLFLEDSKEYEKIEDNTAPCMVFIGDDTCAGVLIGFANSLADELAALGQAVITTDGRYGDYKHIPTEQFLTQNYKAIIGFQALVFGKAMFQNIKGKKIQFWFDNPIFFHDLFRDISKQTYILCQDAYYVDFIREYYDISNAIQFPPGGTIVKNLPCEKIYDVAFVGTYEPLPEFLYESEYEKGFFEYMIRHPDNTYEQGIYDFGKTLGIEYTKEEIVCQLQKVKNVCIDLLHRDRHYVIEKIVSSGIKLHVFSENWTLYQGKGRENLIIHPMIFGEEPFRVWAQSKIGLNIMRGHKAGMTERIANIMLCGACCLSDETVYLNEHFCDGKDIVLFRRNALEDLPGQIRYLLENEEVREKIAMAGYEKALKEHTWRRRAEQLLEMLND